MRGSCQPPPRLHSLNELFEVRGQEHGVEVLTCEVACLLARDPYPALSCEVHRFGHADIVSQADDIAL